MVFIGQEGHENAASDISSERKKRKKESVFACNEE